MNHPEHNLEQRLTEIRAAIERMDFRWDQGFITDKADYLEKRIKLQHELEQLSPIPDDDLERAADILANFGHYWEACGGDLEEQHRLIRLIVERVYVQGEAVVAMTLKADYHVVLGNKANEPTTLSVDSSVCACGDDGCLAGAGCDLFFRLGRAQRPSIQFHLDRPHSAIRYLSSTGLQPAPVMPWTVEQRAAKS